MSTRWCPQCGAEYLATIAICADCGVVLADEPPESATGGGGLAGEEVVFDLSEWEPDLRVLLDRALDAEGIPHIWEGDGELVVPVVFDQQAEAVVDAVENPDQLSVDDIDDGLDGVEAMGELFVAADRLMNDPGSAGPALEVVELAERVRDLAPPFGIDEAFWEEVQLRAALAMRAALDGAGHAAVRETARSLRDLLRPYV